MKRLLLMLCMVSSMNFAMDWEDIRKLPESQWSESIGLLSQDAKNEFLYWAVSHGKRVGAAALLNAGADADHWSEQDHRSNLHEACGRGDFELVRLLVSNGALVNNRGSGEGTPFHIILRRLQNRLNYYEDDQKIAVLLLQSGTDIFIPDPGCHEWGSNVDSFQAEQGSFFTDEMRRLVRQHKAHRGQVCHKVTRAYENELKRIIESAVDSGDDA